MLRVLALIVIGIVITSCNIAKEANDEYNKSKDKANNTLRLLHTKQIETDLTIYAISP